MSERSIIKVENGKIRYTGKVRLPDGTIRVQPEGGVKFIPVKPTVKKRFGGSLNKKNALKKAIQKVKNKTKSKTKKMNNKNKMV